MFQVVPPRSTADLVQALEYQQGEVRLFFGEIALKAFFASQGESWSPALHLRHLIKSVRPVAKALGMSKLLLGILFGRSMSGSRTYEQIRDAYVEALGAGLQAGRYSPGSTHSQEPAGDETTRIELLTKWDRSCEDLQHAMGSWPDRRLDSYRLPHPGLGRLTVREMLYFTLFHNAYHANRVLERSSPGGER